VPSAGAPGRASLQLAFSSATLTFSGVAVIIPLLGPAALLATAATAVPIFVRAIRALLLQRQVKVDILDGRGGRPRPGLPHVLAGASWCGWWTSATPCSRARRGPSLSLLSEIFGGRQTPQGLASQPGREVRADVSELQVGDRIVLHAGEQIPVDGGGARRDRPGGPACVERGVLTGEREAERESWP